MHFFAKLNADPNIEVTYTGLMYRVIHEAKKEVNGVLNESGEKIQSQMTGNQKVTHLRELSTPDLDHHVVKIHYKGRMMDGKVFDSSFKSEPAIFNAKSLIKGLHQGIGKMTRGSVYEFYIPPHLGYGEKGSKFIPAHEPLIFTVQLLDFWKDSDVYKRNERKALNL